VENSGFLNSSFQHSKKVSQIQNAGLGEFKIRDLNDEINKLLREKRHWEARIIELVRFFILRIF